MRRMLFLVAVTLTAVGLLAAPAFGEIEGDCDAYFNGIHFDDIDTAAEAKELLVVQPGEILNLSGVIYGDIDALRVDVVFRPFVLTLADEYEPDSEAGGIETFNIDLPIEFLATYGSGIYEFQGSTDICSGNAFFILGGVEVWDTLIGQVALGTAGLGGLIGLTSWIPTLFTGRVGWGRDIFGGILIGIGAAVVAQQAGEVPLGAMSVGVGVGGGIAGSILIDKVCAGINGVFSGGGSALPPPPSAPPPQSFPDTFQGAGPNTRPEFTGSADTFRGNQPEFTRSADTFQGDRPEPEFTRSADTFQGDQPQVKPDSADAFGGATQPTGQAPEVTSISDTFQPGQPDVIQAADTLPADQPQVKPDSADAFGGATQPTGQAPDVTSISDTFQSPTGDAAAGSGVPTTSSPPVDGSAADAGGQAAPSTSTPGGTPPGSTAPPSSPTGQVSPPDLSAPGQPGSTPPGSSTPASSPGGQVSPPDLSAPGQPGIQPGGTGTGPAGSVSPGATPSGGTPTSAGPAPGAPSSGPAATAPGGGMPMAAIAGVAAPVALASLAKAAAQHRKGKASARDAYWFYVDSGTPVFSMDDHTRQVGELRPGTWYLARAGYEEWVHMKDDDANLEGWVPGWAVKRQG